MNTNLFVSILFLLMLIGTAVLAVLAAIVDRSILYTAKPPSWLRAGASGWTFWKLFWHNARLFHTAGRCFYVVPAHTRDTRLQSWYLTAHGSIRFRSIYLHTGPCYEHA